MIEKSDGKSKWLHILVKLVLAILILKLGMLIGEFKIIKTMVLSSPQHNMQWLSDGADYSKFDGHKLLKLKMLKSGTDEKDDGDTMMEDDTTK